jgi:hypothetical protein
VEWMLHEAVEPIHRRACPRQLVNTNYCSYQDARTVTFGVLGRLRMQRRKGGSVVVVAVR